MNPLRFFEKLKLADLNFSRLYDVAQGPLQFYNMPLPVMAYCKTGLAPVCRSDPKF